MQQGASLVSSGNIAPTIEGQQKETKEAIVLAVVVLFLKGLLAPQGGSSPNQQPG